MKNIPFLINIVTISTFTVYQKGINKVGMNGMMPPTARLFWFKINGEKTTFSMK
jgi:hypothetical protein